MNNLLKVCEVGRRIRKSPSAVVRLIHSGSLPAVKIARSYRVDESDLEAFLARARVKPRAEGTSEGLRTAVASHRHAAAERELERAGL